MRLAFAKVFVAGVCILPTLLIAADMPRLEQKGGRFALVVDGKPFLVLGAQINNSSAWPATLPNVWPALEAMHVNTVEAPVFWEQMEPEPGKFDFSNVDALLAGAREHHLRLVLLWFGTWKNGQAHYIPEWMKNDTKRYPRALSAYGKVLPVLSASSVNNLEADKHAFAALMRHLREADAAQRTVIMVQVENESGSIGTVRDHSPAAKKEFAGTVPPALATALHVGSGNWSQVFGPDADESFAAYSVAHYINEVAGWCHARHIIGPACLTRRICQRVLDVTGKTLLLTTNTLLSKSGRLISWE
jgi:beta-galactosidase GanA